MTPAERAKRCGEIRPRASIPDEAMQPTPDIKCRVSFFANNAERSPRNGFIQHASERDSPEPGRSPQRQRSPVLAERYGKRCASARSRPSQIVTGSLTLSAEPSPSLRRCIGAFSIILVDCCNPSLQVRGVSAVQFNRTFAQTYHLGQCIAAERSRLHFARHIQNLKDLRFKRGRIFRCNWLGWRFHSDPVGHKASSVRFERQFPEACFEAFGQCLQWPVLQEVRHSASHGC